ncbi:hypothetical protein SNE40_001948 [Patella caerulea]|uniref:beta-glucosidase n=1 Tax=Patella caerulea TaxID=87958 RepID=A0AAN8Q6W7_PATCE
MKALCVVLAWIFTVSSGSQYDDEFYYGKFPDGFEWGTATAAYQVEGAWNIDGKGESIWDRFSHTPGKIDNGMTGDVTCDSYHKYKDDVQMLKQLGVNTYRFSISWSRILPDGTNGTINQKGIDYYNNLIDELLKYNIKPMVTLYHWDLPQQLEYRGGWLNEEINDIYAEYARICFQNFGDRVKSWITFNEPWVASIQGYGDGTMAPGLYGPGTNVYITAHNMIRSHAKAYHIYDKEFRSKQNGKIGITLNFGFPIAKDPSDPYDIEAEDRARQFFHGWFAKPIFLDGDYPEVMKIQIAKKSKAIGLAKSRLPEFTEEEKKSIRGTADFMGLNYYAGNYVYGKELPADPPSYFSDQDVVTEFDPAWPSSGSSWLKVYPKSFRMVLNYLNTHYNHPEIYVTENGVSDRNATLYDQNRINYYRDYINEMLKAIRLDGCNVRGFVAWSLMDNFEWARGTTEKFGLFQTDFNDPNRPRTMKASGRYYAQVIKDNGYLPGYPGPAGMATGLIPYENEFLYDDFPANFSWSTATAAYQIEGAWNEAGKGKSIWDVFSHVPGNVANNDTGDIACDSYHQYKKDVQLLKDLKVSKYRFSLSWPRILPDGTPSSLNQAGVDYYNKLIDELLANNIEPMVSLYHWDLPQALSEQGGWLNDSIADWFADYSRVCFKAFGGRVKYWMTINEPASISVIGYQNGVFAPGIKGGTTARYRVDYNMLRAHGKTYRLYQKEFKAAQKGKMGIVISAGDDKPKNPLDNSDVEAAIRSAEFGHGIYANPIYGTGDFPAIVKKIVAEKSSADNVPNRLPTFTQDEINMIKGSADFFGLNLYTASLITNDPSGKSEANTISGPDPNWPSSGSGWLKVAPFALRKMLNRIKNNYGGFPVFITENGVSDVTGALDDVKRITYYKLYINEVLKAIKFDNVDVIGFTAWSLMDNFEWASGYAEKFGLHQVDFNNPQRPRKAKASARWYSLLASDNAFKPGYTGIGGRGTAVQMENEFYYGKFPADFAWGCATAAYQIEGGWNADGKGPSVWDTSTAKGLSYGNETGQIACDSYHKYKEDVQKLKDLGVNHYRFSIAWSRVLPNGTISSLNQAGLDYYHNLINLLISNNIQPVVTLYHWDLPQALADRGGWTDSFITDVFTQYADLCFKEFGDKVKLWITFNEPQVFTTGNFDLRGKDGILPYKKAHNVLISHGMVYRLYHTKYAATQKGRVTITLNGNWAEPKNPLSLSDYEASDWTMQFTFGWFGHPVYVNGDYPPIMRERIDRISKEQGFNTSRLPTFTPDQMKMIKGSHDYIGLNLYSADVVTKVENDTAGMEQSDYGKDFGITGMKDPTWKKSASSWLTVNPWSIRKLLNWAKVNFGDEEIYITENGFSDTTGTRDDVDRVEFYRYYLNEVLKAIDLDKVKVRGFMAWSLMDNFEWGSATSQKFGLYQVDFNDPKRSRRPKASAAFYYKLIKDNGFLRGATSDPTTKLVLPYQDDFLYGDFPASFSWGASTAAYRVEGGGRADGKGESIWDRFEDRSMPDNSSDYKKPDSYKHYLDDLGALTQINAKHYLFSISWSRIMADGTNRTVNQAGIRYYHNLIDELVDAGIAPAISLYYWDLPQALQERGGWLDPSTVDAFHQYARLCFSEFGDRVKTWITLSNPRIHADQGYNTGEMAPGHQGNQADLFKAGHNMLLAHAHAYHLYYDEFRSVQRGQIGIALSGSWSYPKDPHDPADHFKAKKDMAFGLDWFAHPILSTGDYSNLVKSHAVNIPTLSVDQQKMLKGSADFLAVDYKENWQIPNNTSDASRLNPVGLRKLLIEIRTQYNNPAVYIGEIGLRSASITLDDDFRTDFIQIYSNEVLKAIELDGCDVRGFTYNSLIDDFHTKDGLFKVDFDSINRPRIPRMSAKYFAKLIKANGFHRNGPAAHMSLTTTLRPRLPRSVSRSSRSLPSVYINLLLLTCPLYVVLSKFLAIFL